MNSAADALATIRARLAELTARADARRARDAEREADVARTTPAVELVELDTLREDAQLADAAAGAPRPARRPRPAVAPEYVITTTPRAARPQSSDELRDGFAPPAAVPAASDALNSEGANSPLSTSGAATHGIAKLPQARASEDWRARWARIEATVMVCRLSSPAPVAGPFDGLEPVAPVPRPAARSGRGPPSG